MKEKIIRIYDYDSERVELLGILDFVAKVNPQLNASLIPVKAYQIVDHGQIPESVIDYVPVNSLRESIRNFRQKIFREKEWTAWQTGIGGVFYKETEPTHFLPMIDLEITSTPDIQSDLARLKPYLDQLDYEGSIIKSGDDDTGGYYFVGHEPVIYEPNYWQFMGKVMQIFNFGEGENAQKAISFGNQLLSARTKEESVAIGKEILTGFKSIRTGEEREGLLFDPRWIGHKLIDGYTILRFTPGKNYEDKPLQVAEFRQLNT